LELEHDSTFKLQYVIVSEITGLDSGILFLEVIIVSAQDYKFVFNGTRLMNVSDDLMYNFVTYF